MCTKRVHHLTLATACLVLCGCGNPHELETAYVTGTVTLDGQPVIEGDVFFSPQRGRGAKGPIDANGKFILSTYGRNDGATVGQHRIAVIARHGGEDVYFERSPPPGQSLFEWVVPERYSNATTSGLTHEVSSSEKNHVVLELTTNPAP